MTPLISSDSMLVFLSMLAVTYSTRLGRFLRPAQPHSEQTRGGGNGSRTGAAC